MKTRSALLVAAACAAILPTAAVAATWTGGTNASWATADNWSGTAPDNLTAQAVVFDATSTANLTQTLDGSYTVTGITLTSPTGAIIVANGTGTGNTLNIGSNGIDMSSAALNLTLSANLSIGAHQTWTVNGSRTLTGIAGSTTSIGTGTGNINMVQSGAGTATIVFNQNGNGNGWGGYSGNITVNSNVKVQSQGNAGAAFGTGSLTLAGGTIAQNNGTWTWSNNIDVTAASVVGQDSSNGLGRSLKLLGDLTSSNSSGLTFANNTTGGTRTDNVGFVLAGANASTYTTTTISANSRVRIGGNATSSFSGTGINAGTRGSLGTGDVTLSASTSELAFTRTDAHTVGNKITGTGTVVIGGNTAEMSGTSTQVVTLSAMSDYTGATRVSRSRLNLTGSLTSAITVDNSGSISGSGSTTALLTLASGSRIALEGGATTTSITANGATFSGSNLVTFLEAPTATTYDIVTYNAGTVTTPENLTVAAHGSLSNTGTKLNFTATGPATRTWNTTTGTWDNVGTGLNWAEGDQKFFDSDTAVFGDIASDSVITLSGTIAPGSVTASNTANKYTFQTGTIAGTGSLAKSGAGTLALSSANTYSGGTTLTAGILQVGNNSALGTGALALNGGTLSSNSATTFTLANNLTIGGNVAFGDGTNGGQLVFNGTMALQGSTRVLTSVLGTQGARFNGVISNGGITKEGTGRITLANDTNAFAGATTINAGILATSTGALTTSASVTIANGGQLALGGNGTTVINNLSGVSGSKIVSNFNIVSDGARTLQINQTTDGEFAGTFTQGTARTISLNKDGAATLTLSGTATGVNGYTGTTTVTNGTLAVTGALGTTAVTVKSGATLAGNGNITGSVTIQANGKHLLGVAATPASQITRTITGTLTLDPDHIVAVSAPVSPISGTYVLATATGGINGTLGTIQLPPGVSGSVAIIGNNIELTVSAGGDYDSWAGPSGYNLSQGPAGDDDGDGLTNFDEYAFGLDPTNPSSVASSTPPDKATESFSYTRRNLALTDLVYTYEYSTALDGWLPFDALIEETDNGMPVETITVTLPADLLAEPSLFLHVKASIP